MVDPLPALTIALGLAALFAGAAGHKLGAYQEWPGVVRNYRLVPDAASGVVAALLVALEAMTAAALLWPVTRGLGAVLAASLLSVYALGIGINLRRGRTHIDCGCFGARLREGIAPWMIYRNLVLAALALSLRLPLNDRPLAAGEVLFAIIAVATAAFLYPVLAVVNRRPVPSFDENFRASLGARAGRRA